MKPNHYKIHLKPDLKRFTFSGEVTIDIHAAEPTQTVVLHARELEFKQCFWVKAEGEVICEFNLDADRQEAVIQLPGPVQGAFKLRIEYTGLINNQYAGLYRSKYQHNGQEKYLASTQFEAKDARRAFPCFDQPGLKATFDIEYLIDADLTGISNTKILEEKPVKNNKKLVRFERTPPMSTYLVFFGIGEFEFIEDASEEPLMRVATTPGKIEYGEFALDVGRKSLRFGGEYTGIPYPLSKCDYIAIPDSMGAMENFGAIRHSEDDLLVYPGETSEARSVLTAKIIAHEAIHMWFGDLVSPAAWKYLWLNESFATYFTYVIPEHFYPEWGVWEQFFLERMLTGMARDSLNGTIPIDLPNVDDPDADPAPTPSTAPIVYNKGAAVLRMLANYLGEDLFKQAVHDFLEQYQFEAASSQQFWYAVSKSAGIPLDRFAETWIHQPGYPILSVAREGNRLKVDQTRFSYDPQFTSDSVWVIPIKVLCFIADGSKQNVDFVLDQPSQEFLLPDNCTAYKVNADFTGFYRVRYPQDDLAKLGELIRTQTLSTIDSLNVLNDFFTLTIAGEYTVNDYLKFVETYLMAEDRYLPLTDLARNLTHLYRVVRSKRDQICRLGKAIFEDVLEAIGNLPAKDENMLVTELRATLLESAFLFGSEAVSEFGRMQFQALLDGEAVHQDIFLPILKIGASVHPQAEDWLRRRALDDRLPEGERIKALVALGNIQQTHALQEALLLNIETIPSSMRHHMFGEAALNPSAFDWLWNWYTANLRQIEKEIPLSYVQGITVRLAPLSGIGQRQAVETCLQDFMARHPTTADSIAMALEYLILNERLQNL